MDNEINKYDGLVRSIARRYYRAGRMVDPAIWTPDAIDELGLIGVWNALRKYDPTGLHRGYPENTIVGFGIKTEIRKALRLANSGVNVPEEDVPDVADQPTQPLPLPIRADAWLNSRITRPLPAISLEDVPEIAVTIPGPSVEEQATLSVTLAGALDALDARQRRVIEMRYGLGADGEEYLLREVAAEMRCSVSTVWRAEQRALATLRLQLTPPAIQVLDEKRAARARKRAAA